MKKIFAIISVLWIFVACSKQEIIEQEAQDCLVTINLVGEITTSEESLTKSVPSTNDLYVVQVYNGSDPFACGVFDDMSLCRLNLKKGSSYSFRICMVRDAKNYLGEDFNLINNGVRTYRSYCSGSTSAPFSAPLYDIPREYSSYDRGYYYNYNFITGPYYITGAMRYDYPINADSNNWYYYPINRMWYNSNGYVNYYQGSTSTSMSTHISESFRFGQIRAGRINEVSYPTCTDWFYGEVNGYTPNGQTATMDIVLRRTGFGLKYELSGVTDGEVTVKVYNDTRTFIENTTNTSSYESEEQFIAFYDTYSAWQYADDYTENMTVAVTWKRSIGVTQDLGTKVIQVRRNCLNNIKITLGSDDKSAGLSLETEAESSMGATSSTIPVSPAE